MNFTDSLSTMDAFNPLLIVLLEQKTYSFARQKIRQNMIHVVDKHDKKRIPQRRLSMGARRDREAGIGMAMLTLF